MSSLPEPLRRIADELLAFRNRRSRAETPPYIVYVYRPEDEFAVRREFSDVATWLQAHGVRTLFLSLADLFWQALEESGYLELIYQEETQNPQGLALIHTALRQLLTGPSSLADRVRTRIGNPPDDLAVILYRAGALYPVYRTSALLDDLRERLSVPVVLLYPGRCVGPYGLSFMGRLEPAYGYRAMIVSREVR